MEALAEASADDLLELSSNFNAEKGTFLSPSSEGFDDNSNVASAVRYVSNKSIQAYHPPDVVGGGSFEIHEGQPLSDTFTGMIDAVTGELLHGKREYIITGESYEGPFCGGMRHGEGAIVTNPYLSAYSTKESSLPIITSQSRYYGSYLNDRPHHGTLVISSQGLGFSYHGPFLNSRPHGDNGTLVKPSGYKYVGGFKNGLFHGHGIETEESHIGGVYEGEFVYGVRQGYGVYSMKKKEKIFTNVDDNIPMQEEYIYKGQWYANQKQGEGEEILYGAEFYKGQFHMNERHGYGSLTFTNLSLNKESDTHEDVNVSESKHEDSGLSLAETIVKAEGQWRAGKPLNGIHDWTIIYGNGDIYTGFATDFLPKGYGVKRFVSKDVYTGQWSNGKRCGEGIFISADGREEYVGEWVDDKIVPTIEKKEDETLGRITDLAVTLLKRDYRIENVDNLKGEDDNDLSTYHHQKDFLKKVVEQSLSLSLLHFDEDLERSRKNKEFPRSWSKKSLLKVHEKSDTISSTESESSESLVSEEAPNCDEQGSDEIDTTNNVRTKLISYPNGDTYLGSQCPQTNRRQGYGVYVSVATGSTYSGNFESDLREGYGTLLTPLGKYCGEFVCDTKQGMGTLILNDASSYYGLFMNNLFHGKGTLCNKDGTVYVGEWEEGMKSGDGYETLPDGRVYMGDFKHSKRHGNGTLLSEPAGSVLYNGSWLHGVYHGQGLLIKYLEVSKKDKQDDFKPSISGSSGSPFSSLNSKHRNQEVPMIKYEGQFIDGQRHGSGTYTNSVEESEYKGEWRKDLPVSGRWRISMNGTLYSGEASVFDEEPFESDSNDRKTQNDDKDMTSRLSFSNSEVFPNSLQTENMNFPQPDGLGTMRYQNGDVYIGRFEKGLRHGSGTFVSANEERWDGLWFNDKLKTKQGKMVKLSGNDRLKEQVSFEEINIHD